MNTPPATAPAPDWARIETVLLDMDGTILDLAFDNHFWQEHLPAAWGSERGLGLEQARAALAPHFAELRGSLRWYCLDHWSELLGLDVAALKRDCASRIALLDGAEDFLVRVRASGRRLLLVTNAHPEALALKLECHDIAAYFEATVSTHHLGRPKEDAAFWSAFARRHRVALGGSLFVDDSPEVLAGARAGGVAQLCRILAPDSGQPRRPPNGDGLEVNGLADLTPGVPQQP